MPDCPRFVSTKSAYQPAALARSGLKRLAVRNKQAARAFAVFEKNELPGFAGHFSNMLQYFRAKAFVPPGLLSKILLQFPVVHAERVVFKKPVRRVKMPPPALMMAGALHR